MIQKELRRLYYKCINYLSFQWSNLRPSGPKVLFKRFPANIAPDHHCILCNIRSSNRLCRSCQETSLIKPQYQCTCCGVMMHHHALFCGECLKDTPDFDRTFSPYLYQPPLSNMLISFKQSHDFYAGKTLADIFVKDIKQHYMQYHLPYPDFIVAMPQHWYKQWKRGFNHAIFFAEAASKHLSIPLFKKVIRRKNTPDQKGLSRKQRLLNLNQAFDISTILNGEHIAIVDDVMTTRASANALARELKKAGAGQVSVWVLARTPK